jgi:hypothetical protein
MGSHHDHLCPRCGTFWFCYDSHRDNYYDTVTCDECKGDVWASLG